MKPQHGEPVTLENVGEITEMHHVSWKQGGKKPVPYHVKISSVKVWKRMNKAVITYKWGYRTWDTIQGTKENVDFELRENWRVGSGQ